MQMTCDFRKREIKCLTAALFAVMTIYLLLASGLNLDIFSHSPYDSYTRQALAWREGRTYLESDVSYLELAKYNGRVYVSFPPFPSVLMLPLTFVFGGNTPNLMVNMLLFFGSAWLAYALTRRLGISPEVSAAAAVFWVCGCDLIELCLNGGVWNVAQGCGFFMTTASLYAMQSSRRSDMIMGPLLIAFAVGCRPFQAVYVPYVLYKLYMHLRREDRGFWRTLLSMVPYVIMPGLVAFAYGAYNYVRFGDIFEFGHNYLPEFSTEGGKQFSLSHWPQNVKNIFRLPFTDENRLVFPKFCGFAFYLCNPMFIIAAVETVKKCVKNEFREEDMLIAAAAFVHMNLLLLHRTFGGLQFGCRYAVDLVPALGILAMRGKRKIRFIDIAAAVWGILFNIYGTAVFHLYL